MRIRCRISVAVCFALILPVNTAVRAQAPNLLKMTLNFKDVTTTNLNSTVSELFNNEKNIDFGDYDNDGDLDVVMAVGLSDFNQRRNKLYRNDNGVLNEVSGSPVIPGFSLTDVSRTAFFRDFDNDGLLDIGIVNCSNSGTQSNNSPGKTRYYRNVDGRTFINESERFGGVDGGAGSGVAADFDGNGFCDVVLVNHPAMSQDSMALNNINENGPGQFQVVTSTNMPNDTNYGVDAQAADMNGDDKIDLLIGNRTNANAFIYYNDNHATSSGPGDFRYPGSTFIVPDANSGVLENTLAPADFNNDGRMDFYYGNAGIPGGSPSIDAVYVNTGNDAENRAMFDVVPIPLSELTAESIKVTTNDLDNDGRADVIVMSEDQRPIILRNTSENGSVSFLEWTPAVFEQIHRGWQANSADLLGSPGADILVGALNDDFLFENVSSNQFAEDELPDGQLPELHNSDPVQIMGQLEIGDTTTFSSSSLPDGARVSILLRSLGDVSLQVTDSQQSDSSVKVGHGTDEFVFFNKGPGELDITVTVEALSFDGNGDGQVNLFDVEPFIACLIGESTNCDAFDTNDDGLVTLLDVNDFIDRLASGNPGRETFFLEVLSRGD